MPSDLLEAFQKPFVVIFLACLFGIAGIAELVSAGYDQQRGIVETSAPTRYATPEIAVQAKDPQAFKNLMIYKVFRGIASLLVANFLVGLVRKQDESLPFSPGFGGTKANEDLERALDGLPRR